MRVERDVKKEVKKLLDKHKYFWWMPPANGFGRTGISDFQALRDGVFLAIETKFGKKEPTVMQKGFLESVRSQSAFGFVVSDRNLDSLKAWLEAFDRSVKDTALGLEVSQEDGAIMLNAIREMM